MECRIAVVFLVLIGVSTRDTSWATLRIFVSYVTTFKMSQGLLFSACYQPWPIPEVVVVDSTAVRHGEDDL